MTRCKSCQAPITWVKTKAGKSMPLDEVPTEKGNMVCEDGKAFAVTEMDRSLGKQIYTSHFATCPNADGWRKR